MDGKLGAIFVLLCPHPTNRGLDATAIFDTWKQKLVKKRELILAEVAPLFCLDHINVHDFDSFRGDEGRSNYSTLLNQEIVGGDCLLSGQHLNVQPLLFHLQNDFRSHRVPHLGSTTMANNQ